MRDVPRGAQVSSATSITPLMLRRPLMAMSFVVGRDRSGQLILPLFEDDPGGIE